MSINKPWTNVRTSPVQPSPDQFSLKSKAWPYRLQVKIVRTCLWSARCWTWPAWAWRGSTPSSTPSSPAQSAPSPRCVITGSVHLYCTLYCTPILYTVLYTAQSAPSPRWVITGSAHLYSVDWSLELCNIQLCRGSRSRIRDFNTFFFQARRVVGLAWLLAFILALPRNWIQV